MFAYPYPKAETLYLKFPSICIILGHEGTQRNVKKDKPCFPNIKRALENNIWSTSVLKSS